LKVLISYHRFDILECINIENNLYFSAVRFGRVPKLEKAKIKEQIEKVNSQSNRNIFNSILENKKDISNKIIDAYMKMSEFTKCKVLIFLEKAWENLDSDNYPAHMVRYNIISI
jgi:hypothetical protein